MHEEEEYLREEAYHFELKDYYGSDNYSDNNDEDDDQAEYYYYYYY